jgi:hypothetical protein
LHFGWAFASPYLQARSPGFGKVDAQWTTSSASSCWA